MSKTPAESLVDSGIEQSRDDVDDASSNAQTSLQKESETGDDRRSLDPTTLSSLSADEKLGPQHGPSAVLHISPGAIFKNSGSGASSQDPKDSSISSSLFSGKGEAMGGAAMNSPKLTDQRRVTRASRKTSGVPKAYSGPSGSPVSIKSGDGFKWPFNASPPMSSSFVSVRSSPTSTSISSPATVVPAAPATALGPRDLQDGGGQGQNVRLKAPVTSCVYMPVFLTSLCMSCFLCVGISICVRACMHSV